MLIHHTFYFCSAYYFPRRWCFRSSINDRGVRTFPSQSTWLFYNRRETQWSDTLLFMFCVLLVSLSLSIYFHKNKKNKRCVDQVTDTIRVSGGDDLIKLEQRLGSQWGELKARKKSDVVVQDIKILTLFCNYIDKNGLNVQTRSLSLMIDPFNVKTPLLSFNIELHSVSSKIE